MGHPPASIAVHDYPGRELRLERVLAGPGASQRVLAASAAEAVGAIGEVLAIPLSADLALAWCDPELGFVLPEPQPERPFRFLSAAGLDPRVRAEPAWVGAERERAERIDTATLLAWMERALTEPLPGAGPAVLGWRELLVRAVRVRLPAGAVPEANAELALHQGTHAWRYPVVRAEGGVFADGPLADKLPAAPVEIRIASDMGQLDLTLSLLWSLWTDPARPGFAQIERLRERLGAAGWVPADER